MQSSGNQDLVDAKDADSAVFGPQYATVRLTNLDGSGYLRGDWANVVSATGPAAFSPTNTFTYRRDDDRFEQVMAYYWVTQAQLYLRSLGVGTTLPAANAEVVVHEYGHAVQDAQVPGFGAALGGGEHRRGVRRLPGGHRQRERAPSPGLPTTSQVTCVADWDSTSYTPATHCLRTLAENKHYPEDVVGEVHADGEIWSLALWQIRTALGPQVADRVIVNAQFGFAPDTSFRAAATQTMDTASRMYGKAAATTVRSVFASRGLL